MRRRCYDHISEDDPPQKKNKSEMSFNLKYAECLKDLTGNEWKLGKSIGTGGFGEIYLASNKPKKEVNLNGDYVAKVESHRSGPLFVEMNCYIRIARSEIIDEWKRKKRLESLGMPHYVASGSHIHNNEKYRFLILPRFETDLEKILQKKKMFNIKTVMIISMQILDVLEYIHSKGYIHCDIKASNILLCAKKKLKEKSRSCVKKCEVKPVRTCRIRAHSRTQRNLRPRVAVNYVNYFSNFEETHQSNVLGNNGILAPKKGYTTSDQIYLLDYGLVSKYITSTGEHKPHCADERKAHAGTILFCSRDAHMGAASRRSDLECLGFNMIYWLTGQLPWITEVMDPDIVAKRKKYAMANVDQFLEKCFIECPKFLEEYFKYLQSLQFEDKPDYGYCKMLFREIISGNGYKDDMRFDFDNTESVASRPVKIKKVAKENCKEPRFVQKILRSPLQSNIPVKPILRKNIKNKRTSNRKWFKDLTDPEEILKQAREKKNVETESNFVINVTDLNIKQLNPTYAMIEIYNKCKERLDSLHTYKEERNLENIDGYTLPMLKILKKLKQRKALEQMNLIDKKHHEKTRKITIKGDLKSVRKSPYKKTTKSLTYLKAERCKVRKFKGCVSRSYSLRG